MRSITKLFTGWLSTGQLAANPLFRMLASINSPIWPPGTVFFTILLFGIGDRVRTTIKW